MANYRVDGIALMDVDEAVYDVNYARDGRADHDKRIVWMKAAFTAAPHPSSGLFDTSELRIVVDGRASAPKIHDSAVILAGTTKVLSAGFEIDKTATHFEIMIPDGTAEGQRFPVKVADTVLATDIP
jgi:hypothetical protein